MSMADSGSLS